jgi:hypothetical protein
MSSFGEVRTDRYGFSINVSLYVLRAKNLLKIKFTRERNNYMEIYISTVSNYAVSETCRRFAVQFECKLPSLFVDPILPLQLIAFRNIKYILVY